MLDEPCLCQECFYFMFVTGKGCKWESAVCIVGTASANQSLGWSCTCLMSASMLHCDARAFACRSQAGCAADEAKQVRRDAKLLSNHGFAALARPCRATAKPAIQTPLITGVQPQLLFAVRVDPHPCISMLTLGQQCGKQSPGQAWLNLAAGV